MFTSASKLGVLVLTLVATGCMAHDEISRKDGSCGETFTPSRLLSTGSECDGQRVVVRGLLRVGPEMRGLWNSQDDIEQANFLKSCITVYNPRGLKISGPVRWVDVSGTFHAQRPTRLVILGDCTDAILEVERVVDIK